MIPEIIILAITIYCESRGEPTRGKIAVGQVVQKRMIDSGKSGVEVCLKPKQFSCWNDGIDSVLVKHIKGELVKNPIDRKAWRECLRIAQMVMERRLPAGRGWNHFYNPDLCNPSWSVAMKDVEIIGNHKFGRI